MINKRFYIILLLLLVNTSFAQNIKSTTLSLGIAVKADSSGGFRIVEITPGNPADKEGFEVNDIIFAIGDKKLDSTNTSEKELQEIISNMPIDKRCNIEYQRFDSREAKTIDPPEVPYLGIEIDKEYRGQGIRIESIEPDTIASKSRFLAGDIITIYNSNKISFSNQKQIESFNNFIQSSPFDERIKIELSRNGIRLIQYVQFKKTFDPDSIEEVKPNSYEPNDDSIPQIKPIKETDSNEIHDTILDDFTAFDKLYSSRQSGKKTEDSQWYSVAKGFDKYHNYDIPSRWLEVGTKDTKLEKGDKRTLAFLLRIRLIQAQAYLFGAIETYKKEKASPTFIENYQKGIEYLESVIHMSDKEAEYLPEYSLIFEENPWKTGEYIPHEKAGIESVGVGFDSSVWDMDTDVSYQRFATYDYLPFVSLEQFNQYLRTYYGSMHPDIAKKLMDRNISPDTHGNYFKFQQLPTSEKAIEFLSEFCPWGVSLYKFLRDDAKLMKDFDYSVLRPFGTPKPEMSPEERMLHAGGAWNVEMVSETVLEIPNVPVNIKKRLQPIIGSDENANEKWLKDITGTVTYTTGQKQIKWKVVQSLPTYNAWFVSPVCYNMTSAEKFSYSLIALKILTGGTFDLAIEGILGVISETVSNYSGSKGAIYGVTKVTCDGYSWGANYDYFENKKFDAGNPFKEFAKAVFGHYEQEARDMLYEGLNPKSVNIGTSYNGNKIPPVIIRSDIFGYEDVGPYKYAKTRRLLNFFMLDTEKFTGKKYDLSYEPITAFEMQDEYLSGDLKTSELIWPAIPNEDGKPIGSREYITDFTPKSQILKVKFDEAKINSWTNNGKDDVFIEIYSPENTTKALVKKQLKDTDFIIQLNNDDFVKQNTTALRISNDWYIPKSIEKEYFAIEIFTEYTLKVIRGQETLKEMEVNFLNRPEKPASGLISCPSPGHIQLDIDAFTNEVLEEYSKRCSIKIRLSQATYGTDLGETSNSTYYFYWGGEGDFQGNSYIFNGHRENDPLENIKIQIDIDPQKMEVTGFSAENIDYRYPDRKDLRDINRVSAKGNMKLSTANSNNTELKAFIEGEEVGQIIQNLYYDRDSGHEFLINYGCKEFTDEFGDTITSYIEIILYKY